MSEQWIQKDQGLKESWRCYPFDFEDGEKVHERQATWRSSEAEKKEREQIFLYSL